MTTIYKIFKESALRPILSSSRDVSLSIYLSVPSPCNFFRGSLALTQPSECGRQHTLVSVHAQTAAWHIGAKPNIYCEAIELVCGGSPKICVLVEWKALDRVKSEQ